MIKKLIQRHRVPTIPGRGLLDALRATVQGAAQPPVTEMYPYRPPFVTDRTRGAPGLLWDDRVGEIVCTGCRKCAQECPDQCIYVSLKPYDGDKTDKKTIVDEYLLDLALCCYCGICVEVCPYEANEMTPEFAYAGYSPREMILDKDELVAIARGLPRRTPNPPGSPGAPRPLTDADRARRKLEQEARAKARAERAAKPQPAAAGSPPP
ncbi:MAG: 4Fe-4S binding protein [Actinobacteria bacterium]|nr:4Fe-4S binding protein [Actinomycetota bacterium]